MSLSYGKQRSSPGGWRKFAALALMSGMLVSCAAENSDAENSDAGDDQSLSVAIPTDVVSMDPQLQGDMTSMSVADNIFDTLTVREPDGELGPGLATEWEQTDPTTWTFTIRDGVTFHNGDTLDAETVAYSINRLIDPDTGSPIVELVNVAEAVADDESTVRFVMESPDPVLPAKLSLFGGVVVPQTVIENEGADEFANHPIGTGPYEFVSRSQADEIVLKANPDYWGGEPEIENLVFQIMPDPSASLAALQAGQVDIVTSLSTDAADQLEGTSEAKVQSTDGIRTYAINIDTVSDGPLADKRVRQAMNYALDIPAIIDTIQGGAATQVATLIPENVFGHDETLEPYPYDQEQAEELLADAGYEDGFSVELSASQIDSSLTQAVAGQLADVGIDAEVRILEAQSAKDELITLNENYDGGLYLFANSGWTLDSVSFLQSYVKSDRRSSRWDNPEADDLVVAGETETDSEERAETFEQMQQLLYDEAPFVYMFTIQNTYAMNESVEWDMPITGSLNMSSARMN